MPSTRTLQSIVDVVQTAKGMKPLVGVGGIINQPALELCNNTLQELLSSPYNWRFNKNSILPFTTIANQQDYLLSGCNASVKQRYIVHLNAQTSLNGAGLTEAGTVVTATFNDFAPNGFPAGLQPNVGDVVTVAGANDPKYNITATITATPTPTSFQYTAAGGAQSPDGGQGIPGINWLEHVSMQDWQSSASVQPVHDAEIASGLFLESIIQPPIKWAFQIENLFPALGVGLPNIVVPTARAWPVPSSQVWAIFLFFQAKAPVITSLNSTWAPWPDDLSYVLVSMLKARALDWWEDPRFPSSYTIAQQMLLKALASKDQEQRHESMFPDLPILRGG